MAATWLLVTLIWGPLAACLRGMSLHAEETKETDVTIVTQCKGSNLTLHEATPQVTVRYVFRGGETLASASVPATGNLEDRLIVDSDGRVTLTDLKSHDLGTYGVEVQLAEDKRIHSIGLVVREPPGTSDGKLFVMINYFSDSGSIRLKCGSFTTLGFPPVSAIWKDPAGRTLSSDGFKDEYFYLDVPANTADSGDYCCQLDCLAPDFCCLDDQSPLRSCATVHVKTNKKVEVAANESVSPEAFSQLQQQVLDLARSLQESHDRGCRQSAVTAIAHLAELQAKTDAYLNTVKSFEKELQRSLENVKNIIAEDRVQLQIETNQMLENFGLQLDYNISKAMETYNDFHQQLRVADMKLELNQTSLSTSAEALEQRLDNDLLEVRRSSVETLDILQTNMKQSMRRLETQLEEAITNNVSKLEEKQRQLMSDISSLTEHQQTTVQEFTDGRLRTDTRLSALERRLLIIEETINGHVTSSSQSHANFDLALTELIKKTDAVTEYICPQKKDYVWYKNSCLKVSTDKANYETAKAACEADGAHLFVFKSPALDAERLRFAATTAGHDLMNTVKYLVGADDLVAEGNFFWADGTRLSSSHQLWMPNEPNDNNGIEDCVHVHLSMSQMELNDIPCNLEYYYICQYT